MPAHVAPPELPPSLPHPVQSVEGLGDSYPPGPHWFTKLFVFKLARCSVLATHHSRGLNSSCQEGPELFFPIGNTGLAFLQIERAKVVCRRCEVLGTCLSWAMESRQDAGVWGGLSDDQRRALQRRKARVRRAS